MTDKDIEFKELPFPTQCAFWKDPDLVLTPRGRFETVETFDDESHFQRTLRKCTECGQLYFCEFYERIDWEDGDDAQYSTYIPIPDASEAQRMKNLDIYGLLSYTPRLQWDKPTGKAATVKWVGTGRSDNPVVAPVIAPVTAPLIVARPGLLQRLAHWMRRLRGA